MRVLVSFLFLTSSALAQTVPPTGNFVYIDQIGDNNSISIIQQDSDRHRALILNQGDGNVLAITQQGTGQHTASITTSTTANNNNNILSIEQVGTGNHMASILLNNNTGASNNIASCNAFQKNRQLITKKMQISETIILHRGISRKLIEF